MKKLLLFLGLLIFLIYPHIVNAQSSQRNPCWYPSATSTSCIPTSSTNPLPVNATVNASIGGFVPSLSYITLTATASSSASTALPTNTGTVAFQNQTTIAVSCTLATGSAVATTNEIIVPAGSTIFVGTGLYDHAACINQTGSASNIIILAGGSGLGTGFGGGGSGGSGGAVTVVDGGDVTQGAIADAAATAGSTGTVSAKLRLMTTQLGTINSTLGSPFQAGGSIGNTTFASTQSVTWNITNISGTVSLPTGASTSALQTTGNTSLSTIATNTTGASTAANQSTEISSLATIATNTGAAIPSGTSTIGNVGQVYPAGSTPITASATGTTTATTATLAANASIHTYICGFSIRANATGAATNNSTVTGTVTGTLNYTQWTAPLASGIGITEQIFSPCIVSSAINTAIAVISGAPGSGGVVSVTAWGFQL